METIIVKEITKDDHYEVTRNGKRYQFEYSYEHYNWIVGEWDEEMNDFGMNYEPVDGDYGKVQDAIRSYFKLNTFSLFKKGAEWLLPSTAPKLTVQGGDYWEGMKNALEVLGFEVHKRDDLQPALQFIFENGVDAI